MKHPIVISKSIIVNKNNRYQGILASHKIIEGNILHGYAMTLQELHKIYRCGHVDTKTIELL